MCTMFTCTRVCKLIIIYLKKCKCPTQFYKIQIDQLVIQPYGLCFYSTYIVAHIFSLHNMDSQSTTWIGFMALFFFFFASQIGLKPICFSQWIRAHGPTTLFVLFLMKKTIPNKTLCLIVYTNEHRRKTSNYKPNELFRLQKLLSHK